MGRLVNVITSLHTGTHRDYIGRMTDDKVHCSEVARRYDFDYWDGERRYGYGGYRYDGRWAPVAQRLIEMYGLGEHARILDAGCGKAHLLYELSRLLPRADIAGFDVSSYAIARCPQEIRGQLSVADASEPFPYEDKSFDLVISIMALHNLKAGELASALREIQRVGRQGLIAVESYRTVQELFNLQCWALTCESFLRPEGWIWMFDAAGYTGDYEFAFFE